MKWMKYVSQECDNHTNMIWQEGTFMTARRTEMMDAKLNWNVTDMITIMPMERNVDTFRIINKHQTHIQWLLVLLSYILIKPWYSHSRNIPSADCYLVVRFHNTWPIARGVLAFIVRLNSQTQRRENQKYHQCFWKRELSCDIVVQLVLCSLFNLNSINLFTCTLWQIACVVSKKKK